MSQHLRNDLNRLAKRLLALGVRVEEAVRDSITAVFELRADVAQAVIEGDEGIDHEEVLIEEECLKILALHQPVATDLRFVAAVLKINNDLERIGDLAVNIARRARRLAKTDPIPTPPGLRPMSEHALTMVRESLDAFVASDTTIARRVFELEPAVDEFNKLILTELTRRLSEKVSDADPVMRLASVSRALERIGDHATNIAEDVIYLVDGEIIRHTGGAKNF